MRGLGLGKTAGRVELMLSKNLGVSPYSLKDNAYSVSCQLAINDLNLPDGNDFLSSIDSEVALLQTVCCCCSS
jgi:hypothetical protein